jgi:hypothetical protein
MVMMIMILMKVTMMLTSTMMIWRQAPMVLETGEEAKGIIRAIGCGAYHSLVVTSLNSDVYTTVRLFFFFFGSFGWRQGRGGQVDCTEAYHMVHVCTIDPCIDRLHKGARVCIRHWILLERPSLQVMSRK